MVLVERSTDRAAFFVFTENLMKKFYFLKC